MPAFIPAAAPRPLASHSRRHALALQKQSYTQRATKRFTMSTAEAPPANGGKVLLAKAGPDGVHMGDCPFTMKANLALRLKQTDFETRFVDLKDKPAWFLELNEDGTTPVFVDGGHAIADSDEIVEYADRIGRNTGLALMREGDARWDAAFQVVSPVFGSLVRLLKNREPGREAELKTALQTALGDVNTFLQDGDGAFLLGDQPCALDCNLAPKLLHVIVAAKHYKQFEIPQEFDAIARYVEKFSGMEEWKAAQCSDEVIIWGWSKFFS